MALTVWQRTIVDERGNIQPGAVLQVTDEATSALATVYKDRNGTDPWPAGTVTADEFGFARFYAPRGRYRIRSMAPAIDWRDVEIGFQDTDQLQVGDGSEGAPSISFGGAADGFYRPANGQVAVATGGALRATFGSDGAKFKVGGVQTFDIAENRVESTVPMRASDGSAAAPSHSFIADTDTGMYLAGANALGFATGGTLAGRINPDQSVAFGSNPLSSKTFGQLSVSVLGDEAPKFALHRTDATIWQLAINGTTGTAGLDVERQNVQHFRFNTSHFIPMTDANKTLGGSGNRWTVVYATTGTINTSDAREKTELQPLTEAEIAAAKELAGAVGSYRWLDAIQAKGEDGARTHIGITVQRVIEIMRGHGLDPFRYAFVCYDEWEEEATEIEDPEGEIVRTERRQLTEVEVRYRREVITPAGNRYGLRYDQLAMFIARGLEARLAALESAATRK